MNEDDQEQSVNLRREIIRIVVDELTKMLGSDN